MVGGVRGGDSPVEATLYEQELDLFNKGRLARVARCSPLLLQLLGCSPLGKLNLLRRGVLEGAGAQNLEARVDFAQDRVVAILVLLRHDFIGDLIVAVLMAWAMGLIRVRVEGSVGGVRFRQGHGLLGLVCGVAIVAGTCRGRYSVFTDVGSMRERRRRRLGRHKVVDAIERRDIVVGDAGPFSAVAWLAHSGRELSSFGHVRQAVAAEQFEIRLGVNGSLDDVGREVSRLVVADIGV